MNKLALLLGLFLLLPACGDDDDDMGGGADAAPSAADAAPVTPDAQPACSAEETGYGTATLTGQAAQQGVDDMTMEVVEIVGQGALNTDIDFIQIELYDGFGVFTDGIATGTYLLANDELNYMTCGVCVRLFADFDETAMTIGGQYFPTGGTVDITSIDGTLTVDLTDIQFQQVNVDGTTFESTPHPSGCTSSVTSTSLSAAYPTE